MSKEAAIESLRAHVERFAEPEFQKSFAKWHKTVQYRFTDIDQRWHIRIDGGKAELAEGAVDKPDLEWQLTTETMSKLHSGELEGMVAYASGAVKIKGSVTDMLKWRKVTNAR